MNAHPYKCNKKSEGKKLGKQVKFTNKLKEMQWNFTGIDLLFLIIQPFTTNTIFTCPIPLR